jgi:hypothetical protein
MHEQVIEFTVQNPGLIQSLSTVKSGAIRWCRLSIKAVSSDSWCFNTCESTSHRQTPGKRTAKTIYNCGRPFVADVIIATPSNLAHFSCTRNLGSPPHTMFTWKSFWDGIRQCFFCVQQLNSDGMPLSPTNSFLHPLANGRSNFEQVSMVTLAW